MSALISLLLTAFWSLADWRRTHCRHLLPHARLQHQVLLALPGSVLAHVEGPVHYLDLGSLKARCLTDFGGCSLP